MVIQNLKSVMAKKQNLNNKEYLRNLLKEELQVFVLNFVYSSSGYRNLIFTGGTCLRKFYGLPRISEDLDFDYEESVFDFSLFQKDLKRYFEEEIQYKDLELKLKNETLFLKFPALREIGFSGQSDTDILFLRVDFASAGNRNFNTEKLLFSAYDFSFLVRAYDFSTLLANKVAAFLTREYKKGGEQKESFKGRDVFDLTWMLGESRKIAQPVNLNRVYDLIKTENKNEVVERILEKVQKIDSKDLYIGLRSFFEDLNFVSDFCQNFKEILNRNIRYF